MSWFNAPVKRKSPFRLALMAVMMAAVVIMLGAFTRLVDAGLGCPDWPTCYGHALWPDETHEIDAANMAFPETPVETHKTWPEQVHRLFASGLGLISLLILFLSIRKSDDSRLKWSLAALAAAWFALLVTKIVIKANTTVTAEAFHGLSDIVIGVLVLSGFVVLALLPRAQRSRQPMKLPALIVGFVILQGLFGMWTVTLKVWPQVVTTHLLGGFTTLSLLWLLVLRLDNRVWWLKTPDSHRVAALRPWVIAGFAIVIVQVALGGWTTSNYAAVACPDLPTCQTQWWPQTDFAQAFDVFQGIGPSYLGGRMDNAARVTIHLTHRIGAIVTFVYVLLLAWKLFRVPLPETRRMAIIVGGTVMLQFLLGLSNVIFHFPISVAVAHNFGGAVLLLVFVTLLHRVYTVEQR
ncbi:MAG: heme A synthase [Gammaproteobacteria bacterium]|nr:MAG: heme A synthase [Gammaproteobacteria bacterium]